MPVGIQRINAKRSQPNANITFIKPLPGPDEIIAQSFLERIAAQCLPVMREHHLSVVSLEEFEPNREFIGRNFNAGEVVQLVLKSPSSGRWLPFDCVQMVMMHELAHCKQMNHSRAFWAVRNQYAEQMHRLWARGYTGDGIWGRGANLATGEWEKNTVREGEPLPEHLCGGTYRSRRRKDKPQQPQLTYQERKQRRIEKRFGKNGVALGADQNMKVKLERGKKVIAKPRVAGSARGRELRAAAALARFDEQKEVLQGDETDQIRSLLKDEDEMVSASDSEEDGDRSDSDVAMKDALNIDGSRMVDNEGRTMVKICEDENHDDPSARGELAELREVFIKREKDAAAATLRCIPEQLKRREAQFGMTDGALGVKRERVHDNEACYNTMAQIQPYIPTSIKAESLVESSLLARPAHQGEKTAINTDNTNSCPMCSYKNDLSSLTCLMCGNVLNQAATPNAWRCQSNACKESLYLNSGDYGVCAVCGQRRK